MVQVNGDSSYSGDCTILVTGGAGLVGKELIGQLISRGKKVRAVYNKNTIQGISSPLLEQVHCNILDVAGLALAMDGIQQVYHCAAIVTFNPARQQEMFKVNIEGTANVVNAALDAGVQKIVHVSSVAALGRLRKDEAVTEKMNWTEETSNSKYGQSKYLGELEVWRGVAEGLDAVIINPVIILGDGGWNAGSSQIFKSVYEGFPWYSDGVTGFVDVRDVAATALAKVYFDNSKLLQVLPGFKYHSIEDTVNYTCTRLQQKLNSR